MSEEVEVVRRELRVAREELTRVEEELREIKEDCSANGPAVEEMSSLRQQLRTPLNTVLGFAQLLKSSPFGDCEAVQEIFSAATRLAELIGATSGGTTVDGERAAEAERISTKPPDKESHTVLCIEDNPANSRLIDRILAHRDNINLLFATKGSDGLALAREHQPALILLDLDLPDLHGAEVLRCLREDRQTENVPVVVISADATATQIERLLSSGARNYLTKPIDVARFLYTVDEILDGP